MDELTTEEEIASATWSVIGASVEMKVFVSKANSRGQKMMALKIGAKDAAKLSLEGHLKISWLRCWMREKLVTPSLLLVSRFRASRKALQRPRQKQLEPQKWFHKDQRTRTIRRLHLNGVLLPLRRSWSVDQARCWVEPL